MEQRKKFDPVRTELLLKSAPNCTVTLCWAIPICVLEKSLVEKRREEIKKEVTFFYHEAQRKAQKHYHHKSRVEDALVHYWWQKENMLGSWYGHPFDDAIVDTLRGYPPDNFQDMMLDYKRHGQRLFDRADNDNGYGDGPEDLYRWRRWQMKLRSDLNIFFEVSWKVGTRRKCIQYGPRILIGICIGRVLHTFLWDSISFKKRVRGRRGRRLG